MITFKAAQQAKADAEAAKSKAAATGKGAASAEEEARMMALRNATDKPVIVNRRKKKAPAKAPKDEPKAVKKPKPKSEPLSGSKLDRKEKRSGSSMRASVTFEDSTHARS